MYLFVEVLVTVFVLGAFAFIFFKFWTDPAWLPRQGARLVFLLLSESERKSLVRRFPRIGYCYYGTTGDEEKDMRIRRFDRIWFRGIVIVWLSAAVLVVVIGVLIAVLSGDSSR